MIKIVLPSVWTQTGRTEFEATEGPLVDVIKRFAADNPEFSRRLLGPDGEPAGHINICLNDDLVPRHLRALTTIEAGITVTIITAMAGG